MAVKKRRFYEGQNINGKIVKEIFKDSKGYYLHFTDGTYQEFPNIKK